MPPAPGRAQNSLPGPADILVMVVVLPCLQSWIHGAGCVLGREEGSDERQRQVRGTSNIVNGR